MTDHRKRVRGTDDPINPPFSEGRWQDALRRMRSRIEDGLPLELEDRTISGDKSTSASWGMCSSDPEQWPDPDDHIFPAAFVRSGRVAPRDPPSGARCPMDVGDDITSAVLGHYGCFYRCLLFQGPKHHLDDPTKLRLHVLNRYDDAIAARAEKHGERTSEPEPWSGSGAQAAE